MIRGDMTHDQACYLTGEINLRAVLWHQWHRTKGKVFMMFVQEKILALCQLFPDLLNFSAVIWNYNLTNLNICSGTGILSINSYKVMWAVGIVSPCHEKPLLVNYCNTCMAPKELIKYVFDTIQRSFVRSFLVMPGLCHSWYVMERYSIKCVFTIRSLDPSFTYPTIIKSPMDL